MSPRSPGTWEIDPGAVEAVPVDRARLRSAREGRISGCQLGKPVEVLSMAKGRAALEDYLKRAGALPLRDHVPRIDGTLVERFGRACCRGELVRAEPDVRRSFQ